LAHSWFDRIDAGRARDREGARRRLSRQSNALGTSRVLTIDPREFPRIGWCNTPFAAARGQEVVLTFDDADAALHQSRARRAAEHCVKANYFLVGRMARAIRTSPAASSPRAIHRTTARTICSIRPRPVDTVKNEIERGIVQ